MHRERTAPSRVTRPYYAKATEGRSGMTEMNADARTGEPPVPPLPSYVILSVAKNPMGWSHAVVLPDSSLRSE